MSEQEVLLLVTHDASVNYKNIPLESYLQYIKREFENRSRFIYSSPQPDKTDVGGLPAYSMEFVNMNGMHGLVFVVVNKGNPYVISYVGLEEKIYQYLPTAVKILTTLKFS